MPVLGRHGWWRLCSSWRQMGRECLTVEDEGKAGCWLKINDTQHPERTNRCDHRTVQPENAERVGSWANEFQTSQPHLQVCALAKFSEGPERKIKGNSWELIQECGDPGALSRIPRIWAHFVKALVEQVRSTGSLWMQHQGPAFSSIYSMSPSFKGTGEVKLSQQSKQQATSTYLGTHTHTHALPPPTTKEKKPRNWKNSRGWDTWENLER